MFGEDEEGPAPITRDSEPEEYFSSGMDKKTDKEKLPYALAALGAISLPFIFGLVFLYASR